VVDSPNSGGGLLDEFRRRLGDTAYNFVQCEVSCDDPAATVAIVEVTDSHFITTITGGATLAVDLDLTDPAYDTIEKLVNFLAARTATKIYRALMASNGEPTHASTDLAIIPPTDFLRRSVQLKSRRWSDAELTNMLNVAITKLSRDVGVEYSLTTVPSAIKDLLFLLGNVEMYWDQINNVSKRQGTDLRVEDFRTLHQALLDEYGRSLAAYKSSLPIPVVTLTPEQLDDMGSGEIIVGTQIRRNLRTGRWTPSSAVGSPAAEQIEAVFIGGAKIQLSWTRSRHANFHHYEIWRGTTADVSNISEVVRPLGSVQAQGVKIRLEYDIERTLWIDGGSSPLPPGAYFYKLYVFNHNGEFAGSQVASATVI
jgi:hypothetical protein